MHYNLGVFYTSHKNAGRLFFKSVFFGVFFIVFFLSPPLNYISADDKNPAPPVFAGEFFGTQVPLENYIFIRNNIAVFGNKWGPQPQSQEDMEKVVWDQLLLSFEAFRRGIAVSQEETNEEISKILAAERVEFDWKNNRVSYEKWVKDKTNASAEIFEGQLKHLIQLHKLRQSIMEGVDPPVSDEEAFEEFLNEQSSLGVELVQFDEKKDAEGFYNKTKSNPNFWEGEKEKRPKDFKQPGNVSLEFLIDIWEFRRDACYRMLKMKAGQIHPPAPIYRGYGVCKILTQSRADKSRYPKAKAACYEQIKNRKRFETLGKWFEDLKKQASIKIYEETHEDMPEKKDQGFDKPHD